MSDRVRYFLDENFPEPVADGLRSRGVDLVTAQELGLRQTPDQGGFSYGYVGSLGVRTDATTGLIWMRHQWYDPSGLQRFLSRDVLGSLNRYEYCYLLPSFVSLPGRH